MLSQLNLQHKVQLDNLQLFYLFQCQHLLLLFIHGLLDVQLRFEIPWIVIKIIII